MYTEIYRRFADKYDLVTFVASFGVEWIWRWWYSRKLRQLIEEGPLADVAAATGEVVRLVCPSKAYLVDPSPEMLGIAIGKLERQCPGREFHFLEATAEEVQFPEKIEVVSAFMACRNFDDLEKGITNLAQQLKPGGYLAIVELVHLPGWFGRLGLWYLKKVVPVIGGWLTGHREDFYHLGESVERLREEQLLEVLDRAGLKIVERRYLFPRLGVSILAQKGF